MVNDNNKQRYAYHRGNCQNITRKFKLKQTGKNIPEDINTEIVGFFVKKSLNKREYTKKEMKKRKP